MKNPIIHMYVNVDWFYMSHRSAIGKALVSNDFYFTVFTDYSEKVDKATRNANNLQNLHSSTFNIDESSIKTAMGLMSYIAIEQLL